MLCKTQVTHADVGYISPITPFPTRMNIIYAVIGTTLHIRNNLSHDHMFLGINQAIYTNLLDMKNYYHIFRKNRIANGRIS